MAYDCNFRNDWKKHAEILLSLPTCRWIFKLNLRIFKLISNYRLLHFFIIDSYYYNFSLSLNF